MCFNNSVAKKLLESLSLKNKQSNRLKKIRIKISPKSKEGKKEGKSLSFFRRKIEVTWLA
jgi:hypothetical protein